MEMIKNIALQNSTTVDTPNWMVVVMGVGVVFLGLVLIIVLCKIMGSFFVGATKTETNAPVAKAAPVAQAAPIENRQEIIAAVTAACAEEMGKDISALRVVSFKKL